MIFGKKICVVLPAYNAERTLRRTVSEIPREYVDDIVLVDDASTDNTIQVARDLGVSTVRHVKNIGYGGNQKTCYKQALERGADIVIMLHPDYQYSPKLLVAMGSLIALKQYDIVLGSRVLAGGALRGGMPLYKYVSNRVLSLVQNLLLNTKLSEFHTGYRAFSREVLETLPLANNSDDFVFDNQVLAQAIFRGFSIGEISCPAQYHPEASSINLKNSILYGFGVLNVSVQFRLARIGLYCSKIFR